MFPTCKGALAKLVLATLMVVSWMQARAVTFTSITVIGDSLFDGGNEPTAVVSAYKIYGVPADAPPKPGYYNFKYCDGYTGAEYFAYYLGLYDTGHFFNYSVAGLSSIELPLVLQQIYLHAPVLDPTGLYVIFVGAHDVFQSKISRDATAENITNAVTDLYSHGARYFMVMNLAKMSDLPSYRILSQPEIESVDIAYQAINAALKPKLSALSFQQNIIQYDMPVFSQLITQYAMSVGFTDISTACTTGGAPCATPSTFIYWDDIHYTNATNGYLGASMKSAVDAAALN